MLADALAEADRERPDLLLDAATLTGAARVALGPELPALFTPDDELAQSSAGGRERHARPLVASAAARALSRLPQEPGGRPQQCRLQAHRRRRSRPPSSSRSSSTETRAWAHLDTFAWNDEARPGRPRGGEATGPARPLRPPRSPLRRLSRHHVPPDARQARRLPLFHDASTRAGRTTTSTATSTTRSTTASSTP